MSFDFLQGHHIMVTDKFCSGFAGLRDGVRVKVEGNSRFDPYRKILDKMHLDRDESTWVLGWQMPENPVDFTHFTTPQTIQLVDEEYRLQYIDSLIDEVEAFLSEFLEKAIQ